MTNDDQPKAEEPAEKALEIPESTDAYLVIPTRTVQLVLNYLDSRPHREVRGLIDLLLSCNPKAKPKT